MHPATPTRPTPDHIGIYRLPQAKVGHVLHVVLRRNGVVFKKRFWEHRCGEAAAMQMALAWRDSVIANHPPIMLAQFCSIVRRNNTSGIPGVARREKHYRASNGEKVINAYWVARVPRGDGTSAVRHFPVTKFGEEEARRMAIAARERGLEDVSNVVFRAVTQPVQVSTRADMEALEALLNEPAQRRAMRAQQRAQREQINGARRLRKEEALRIANAQRIAHLAAPSNRSGEPYIGRYLTKAKTGNWRVSIVRNGVRHRKIFSDSVFGSADAALAAAKAWRDNVFIENPTLPAAAVVARVNVTNTSGTAGVSFSRPSGKTKSASWVARSPKVKGVTTRSKRFSIEKYGNDQALALAVKARAAFVAALGDQPFLRHPAAWQVQKLLIDASSNDSEERPQSTSSAPPGTAR